jgi:hypothetical protein
MNKRSRPIGERFSTDATTRPIFELPDGRQYVEHEGERVYGTWLPPADETVTATAELQLT